MPQQLRKYKHNHYLRLRERQQRRLQQRQQLHKQQINLNLLIEHVLMLEENMKEMEFQVQKALRDAEEARLAADRAWDTVAMNANQNTVRRHR
jgi:hypothetical protein